MRRFTYSSLAFDHWMSRAISAATILAARKCWYAQTVGTRPYQVKSTAYPGTVLYSGSEHLQYIYIMNVV